jgi:cellulose biosynthesis protein BcsQ
VAGLTKTAIFANSKGGVGKSSIALLMSLGLATRHGNSKIELIDLDPQATTSDSLQRFANSRLSVVRDESFHLGNELLNNAKIISHIESKVGFSSTYLIFDTPAGTDPERSSFFLSADIIFVPTSVSDADIFATKKFLQALQKLFNSDDDINSGELPTVVILPSIVDSREEFNEVRSALSHVPGYLGKPLFYSPLFRRAFRAQANDNNVRELLINSSDYIEWLTSLLVNSETIKQRPTTLFQL